MSSAILYLAIVAIWAVVLVPRWLRPRSAQPQAAEQPEEQPGEPQSAAPEPAEPVPPQPADPQLATSADPELVSPADPELVTSADADWREPADPGPGDSPAWTEGREAGAGPVPAPPSPAARRADILQARRRMLAMTVALTAGAVGLAVTGIAASWVIFPPAVLLAGFLVLLREAARFDAERARRATRIQNATVSPVAGQEPGSVREDVQAQPGPETGAAPAAAAALAAAEPPPSAEVIDISGRISDQVYDQYSDAADRAVGD